MIPIVNLNMMIEKELDLEKTGSPQNQALDRRFSAS